jgi:hypothetical protein
VAVPLTRRAEQLLRRLKQISPEEEVHVFLHRQTGPKNGQPRKKEPFRRPHKAFYSACERAGIADFRIHDTRHTFASRLVMRGVCGQIHNRMPVILPPKEWPLWLGEDAAELEQLKAVLQPYPVEDMKMWPVSSRASMERLMP